MIKNAEVHTNGAPPVPTRLAMNRLGPQKGMATPPPMKKTAGSNGQADDSQNRLTARKMAEDKARARTVARAQAVAYLVAALRQLRHFLELAHEALELWTRHDAKGPREISMPRIDFAERADVGSGRRSGQQGLEPIGNAG